MIHKTHFTAMLCIGAALLLPGITGCVSPVREMPQVELAKEPKTPEHELCRKLLIAFLNDDAKSFVKLLPTDTRKNFDVKEFNKTRKALTSTIGEPVSFRYLTRLEFVSLTPHLWLIRFKRTDKKGQIFYSEALFRIITGRAADGTVLVISFHFL
ncbi:MAG: hypothetical protein PHS41_03355 [Victivallaceae bacterium]|nr:hypothetical protein [Victivallaceae bacterium]